MSLSNTSLRVLDCFLLCGSIMNISEKCLGIVIINCVKISMRFLVYFTPDRGAAQTLILFSRTIRWVFSH
uniref:Uncharacterized protein n=1 Tax=Papilio xuthus TaxID=66420 RepID=I4DQG6_PAPXU|nr:unknown unsecreted protein [Papilio xuthus]